MSMMQTGRRNRDSAGLGLLSLYNFPVPGSFLKTARLTALLVHGMGGSPSWWNPLLPVLKRAGLAAIPLRLPSLEDAGPEMWCDEVLNHAGRTPIVLIGHSLGAAVCMEAARVKPVKGLVLLACPPFLPDFTPQPPPDTGLSAAAIGRVGRFLRRACKNALLDVLCNRSPETKSSGRSVSSPVGGQVFNNKLNCVHFVGSSDRWVPVEQARRLPFPLVVIPGTGHGLNRSTRLADQLLQHLLWWQKSLRD
jgi:pimeloyl-ACP methyl ester carboxylesterase